VNTNYLAGFKCPKCGAEKLVVIRVSADIHLHDAGSVAGVGNIECDDQSPCTCCGCRYAGTVGEFKVENLTKTPRPKDPLVKALESLIETIEVAGGLDAGGNPVGEPGWYDLGQAYLEACAALGRQPVYQKDDGND
jgi:hypothetical protein